MPLRLVGWNQAEARKQDAWWRNVTMAWTTPTLVEICIGLEINGYLPAEI
ncbi:MAG TPA: pyrroloquinoline quinone precursor peptide PqqA [Xanthobacteraceae bacterium]|nr:pyrroloquinoline quinone precursor peptide PqqA [Xanthobacteraceae bacterium]